MHPPRALLPPDPTIRQAKNLRASIVTARERGATPGDLGSATVRADELARIVAVVDDPHEAALLVVGEPGAGKSRLLASVTAPPDMEVCRTRASMAESGIALAGLSAIASTFDDANVRGLADGLLTATRLQPRSATVLTVELLSLFRRSATRSTVVLIDDLHLFDVVSRRVVAMMAKRLGGTGLRIVATAEPPLSPELASLPRMDLLPLGTARVGRLVAESLGTPADPAINRIIATVSAGNPGAARHISRRMPSVQLEHGSPVELPVRAPDTPGPPAPAGSSSSLVIRRLSAAYLNSETAITRRDPKAEDAVEELLSAGLVIKDGRRLRLRDPMMRSRVYWSMDAGERQSLHSSAAHAEAKLDPCLAAWHRSWRRDDTVGAEELLRCAIDFAGQGSAWQAVELAERALAVRGEGPTLCRGLFDLAATLFHAGEIDLAERYARFSGRCRSNELVAPRLALLRAAIDFVSGSRLPAAESELVSAAVSRDDRVLTPTVLAAFHLARWETEEAGTLLESAASAGGADVDVIGLRAAVAALLAAMEGDGGPVTQALARALDGGDQRSPRPSTLLILGRGLTYLDRDHDARQLLRAIEAMEPPPTPLLLEIARSSLAELEIRAGDEAAAVAVIDRALGARDDRRTGSAVLDPLRAWRLLATGDLPRAAELMRDCHRRYGVDDPALSARLVAAWGRFELAAGRFDDAAAHLAHASSLASAVANPTLLRCDADLVEALVLADRSQEAAEQAKSFMLRSAGSRTPWTLHARALTQALVSPGDDALRLFDSALRRASSRDLEFARARTLLCLADRLEQMGRRREALTNLRRARAVFEQVGARSWLGRTDGLTDGGTAGHPLLTDLPVDELRVVRLVQQGKRNKEIAAELYVSLRTVEVRLTRIYHRLGVGSRAELLSLLARPAPPTVAPLSAGGGRQR